jgi:hypothetical protein
VAAPAELLPLRPAFRAAGVLLLGAAGVCAVAAAALGHPGAPWAAWAIAAYVSWAVALRIVARRRLARAAAGAERVPAPAASNGVGRPGAVFLALLAAVVGGAVLTGATHVTAGILAAAGSTALAATRWTERLEQRGGCTLHVDRATRRLVARI